MTSEEYEFNRLGYALWPEHLIDHDASGNQFNRLGYALWPELARMLESESRKFNRLGYALWPEPMADNGRMCVLV